jgi:hypothetical protein
MRISKECYNLGWFLVEDERFVHLKIEKNCTEFDMNLKKIL